MKQTTKTFWSAGLAAMLVISMLAGCSGTSDGSSSAASNSSASSGAASSGEEGGIQVSENFNAEGLPILKEPETFTAVAPQNSTKVANQDKECYIKTAEETNVYFDWVEIPQANWTEKTNVMFASGDLPDVFISDVDVATQYEQLTILDDYVEEYCPYIQQLIIDRPEYEQILTAPDGHIHFLPTGDEAYMNQIDAQHWINQNWLDNLNLEVPTTTDEFYEVLKAFKEQDANGNGDPNDEIPFTFNGVWTWATGLFNMFGSFGVLEGSDHVYVVDDVVHFAPEENGYYEALKYFNKLYSEGLIDPEVFTQSADQYNSRGDGKDIYGSLIGYRANYVLSNDEKDDYVGVLPLTGPNGDQMIRANYINQLTGFQITIACEQPEVLVRWYDYVNSTSDMVMRWNRGLENINWKYWDDGEHKYAINLPVDPDSDPPVERNDTTIDAALWTLHREEANSIINPESNEEDRKWDLIEASMPYAVYGMPTGLDTAENTQQKSLMLADIDTYLEKFIADSIMNGIDDAKWQEHLNTLQELKAEEYKQLQQDFLDR